MHGKTVLVTGASTGVGLAMASALAGLGASVLMVSRDPERGERARQRVAAVPGAPEPRFFAADLSSQRAVHDLGQRVRRSVDRLDVMIHNAGAAFPRRELSADGIEKTLATNHLGAFLLTHVLFDLVCAAPAARVVTVTGELHGAPIDFDDLGLERRYHFLRAYALSKTANILFTYELARRVEGTPITASCFSPGPTATDFGRGAPGLLGVMSKMVRWAGRLRIANSAEQGARAGILLASSPDAVAWNGCYISRGKPRRSRPVTHDALTRRRLWEASERLCGIAPFGDVPPIGNARSPTSQRDHFLPGPAQKPDVSGGR